MKIYIILLASLDAGLKMAQACHALREFQEAHPAVELDWYTHHKNVAILEWPDLSDTQAMLETHHLRFTSWHEPDLDNALTAICAEPASRKALARYPLASASAEGARVAA